MCIFAFDYLYNYHIYVINIIAYISVKTISMSTTSHLNVNCKIVQFEMMRHVIDPSMFGFFSLLPSAANTFKQAKVQNGLDKHIDAYGNEEKIDTERNIGIYSILH